MAVLFSHRARGLHDFKRLSSSGSLSISILQVPYATMPELPDIAVYVEALEKRLLGQRLERVRVASPFLLRTAEPPIEATHGRKVVEIRRIGKRIAIELDGDLWMVIHLMIAGRLHWRKPAAPITGRGTLAAFDFKEGTLTLTESGTKKRASLHVVATEDLSQHDPAGLEVLDAGFEDFAAVLQRRNHTLKRALTDPTLFSGIGNAFSDEILHAAGLSPIVHTQKLGPNEVRRLFDTTQEVLRRWIELLRNQTGDAFPEKVTAFRPEMAVHGKFGQSCPTCGTNVQRIRYAENETNYCPRCQTEGKVLADRSLSRLLKSDWPRTIEELEASGVGRRRTKQ